MNQTEYAIYSLLAKSTNLIGYWPTYFKHLIQNCTTQKSFPFLSLIMLGSQSPANDPLELRRSIFNMALQIVS